MPHALTASCVPLYTQTVGKVKGGLKGWGVYPTRILSRYASSQAASLRLPVRLRRLTDFSRSNRFRVRASVSTPVQPRLEALPSSLLQALVL